MGKLIAIWSVFVLAGLISIGCGSSVERNIDRLAGSQDEREQAMMELVLAKQNAIPPLIQALNDTKRPSGVRADVADILFRMYVRESDRRIMPALLDHVDDKDAKVRAKIATVLGYIDKKEAIQPLLKRLEIEQDSDVRYQILCAIEALDKWEISRQFGGRFWVTGGENMTDEEKAKFIEILNVMWREDDSKEAREKAEELLEKRAEQIVEEADKLALKADLRGAEGKYLEAKELVPNSKNVNQRLGKFYFDNGWEDKGLAILRDQGMVLYAKRLRKIPTIDGDLNDDAWKYAVKITEFYQNIGVMRTVPAEGMSEAYIGYTDKNLYIAVKGYEESTKDLTAKYTQRDENVWMDDCAEVFFDPDHDYNTFYQIVVNSIGTVADYSYGGETYMGSQAVQWNGEYRLKTKVEEKFWTLEMEIPFKELGGAKAKKGDIWGFNIARVRIAHKGEYDQWVPTYGTSLRPDRFGFLIFD